MKNVVIIQARMGSTRLPGKVLKVLADKTVLAHVVERAQAFQDVADVIVATTVGKQDNVIEDEARRLGVAFYRGDESDVLSRYYEAAVIAKADNVIRITSDCPMVDPETSSGVIKEFLNTHKFDYVSNTLVRSYPRGLDTEIFTFEALETAHKESSSLHDREHVTPYIYNNPDKFLLHSYVNETKVPDYRWTLDTPEDWDLINRIYNSLHNPDRIFPWRDAVALMQKNPDWNTINQHIQQKH
ncbi:glycosyltransferase family protein [Paenibacillus sp. HWE-109]|uniref:cytidylyltransferase domain-containing protein n=1 Tax=Paenibacillus sp. HWE-109 TaxID=1306526 RepID=UPI001EE01A3B|nr:glycosyltransferase family protein [Paenibacillus sp. HWE-109]UKS26144.1 glycosyltransferase family protein [Paenibacillus sp. HWE-109]